MKTSLTAIIGAAACVVAGGIAYASVTVDIDGIGFVGKGDVQLAMDPTWNNAQLQKNAESILFRNYVTETISFDCVWETVTGGPKSKTIDHSVTKTSAQVISNNVAYDARTNKKGQITGFNLNGWSGNPVTTGTTEAAVCKQQHGNAVAENIGVVEGSSYEGLQVSGDSGATWRNLQ